MAALIIDGRQIAGEIRAEVKARSDLLKSEKGITPGLAFILVGDNPASESYVRMKGKACQEMGFHSVTKVLPREVPEEDLLGIIHGFNMDPLIHGILVQLPLPPHISEQRVLFALDPGKDVDGFHPVNIGRLVAGQPCLKPCTPLGVQELLRRSGHDPGGKHVVIAGRSNIVGKPLANILLQKSPGANAVVTLVHTGAPQISSYTLQADILVAAMGQPGFITGDMVKPGSVVIDVGINRVADPASKGGYRLTGDVDFDSVSRVAGAISPVPGGVGPMTIAMLMQNTLMAASGAFRNR